MKSKFTRFAGKLMKTIGKPEMGILPGQLAFFFVLSMIPLIALFCSIAVGFGFQLDSVIELLKSIVHSGVVDLLLPMVSGKSVNFNILVFYVSAFILASNGTHSMILCSNTLYKFENKDYLSRRIKALLMTIILVMLLLFVLVVPAFGGKIIAFLGNIIKNETIIDNIYVIYILV